MRTNIQLLTFALLMSSPLSGEIVRFNEYNFSLETPSSWQTTNPPPDNTIGFLKAPDDSKGVVVMAFKFQDNQLSTALEKMISGAKKSARAKGSEIENEESLVIDGVPFQSFTAKISSGVSVVSYFGVAGSVGYSLQGFSKVTDAGEDSEISTTVGSFKLLAKPSPVTAGSHSDNVAYKFGQLVGGIAVVGFFVGLLWIGINRSKNQNTNRDSGSD